ncbi:MAG TPA: MFS transporter [Mycobacteriales bacterium]|nr:MFS transporter [Mycobacteriales bacterium]
MGRLEVLRIRDFRLLFSATTIDTIGNTFTSVALAFGILDSTHSARDIGIVLAARAIAQVAFVLVGGAWGDRVSRRTIMLRSALVCGLTQSVIAALFLTGSGQLWSLSLLAAVNGAATALAFPAATGILPQVVPVDLVQGANALNSVVRNSASIGGAALGGVLVAVASPGWALAIDAVSFFLSAVLIWRMAPTASAAAASNLWHEVKEGWREFTSRTWVWAIVVQFTIANMAFTATADVYAPIIAKLDLGGPAAYGAMISAVGVGGVLGGLAMIRFSPRRPLVAATFGILVALGFFALLAAGAPLWSVVVAAGVLGFGVEVFSVLWESALQRYVPAETLSRVSAYDMFGSIAFVPIGLVVAGPVSTALGGVHDAVWGMLVLVAVPTMLVLGLPDVWRLGSEPDEGGSVAVADPQGA